MSAEKLRRLRALKAQLREDSQTALSRKYIRIHEMYPSRFDSECCLTPWSKTAGNVNSSLMIIGQDWASEKYLSERLLLDSVWESGFDPEVRTNKNLQMLLFEAFGLRWGDVYATNNFKFIKPGDMSSKIPDSDMVYCAQKYTLPEIEIVAPRIVICLGLQTYNAIQTALSEAKTRLRDFGVSASKKRDFDLFGSPHPADRGLTNFGGREHAVQHWKVIRKRSLGNAR